MDIIPVEICGDVLDTELREILSEGSIYELPALLSFAGGIHAGLTVAKEDA